MSVRDYLFHEEPGITLYCGDCREVLPLLYLQGGACVTDPPYGINYRSNHNSSRRGKWARWVRYENMPGIVGDDKAIDATPLLDFDPLVIFGGNYIANQLPPTRCWIVWDKRDGIGANNQADCEMAWTSLDKPSRIHRQMWSGLLRAGESNVARSEKLHPHEKPVELMRFVILYAEPDRSLPIIDPYCGSGPVLQAAKELGYPAIGIEIEERYCQIAVKRLRQEVLPL